MTLNYQLTLDDYVEANKSHSSKRPLEFYGIVGIGILSFLFFVFAIMLHLAGGWNFNDNDYWVLAGSLMSGFYLVLPRTILYKQRVKSSMKPYSSAFQQVALDCSTEQLNFQLQDSASQNKWSRFTEYKETKNLLLLYLAPRMFHVIPKRAFANEEDLNQFRAWVSQIGHEPAPNSPLPEIK